MTANEFYASLSGKRITFVGVGRSNLPLIEQFKAHGAAVSVRDKRSEAALGEDGEALKKLGAKLICGEDYLESIDEDMLFRAPGVPYLLPELQKARANGVAVTSEMEVFFDLCPCKIYAVTGSDGKTTTTSVIAEMLKAAGKTVHLGGNIGRPLLPEIRDVKPEDVAVVELSSFQLISMRRSPNVAVITNLSPNHLDVHKDMDEYVNAKKNVLLHQNAFGRTVLNADNALTAACAADTRGMRRRTARGAARTAKSTSATNILWRKATFAFPASTTSKTTLRRFLPCGAMSQKRLSGLSRKNSTASSTAWSSCASWTA